MPSAKKLAQHGKNSPFWAIFGALGKKCRAFYAGTRSGANFLANHHTLATQRTPTVQNSPGTRYAWPQPVQDSPRTRYAWPQPVQNSPRTRYAWPQPVQNSPRTAKNTHFGPFDASREKIIPVETQTTRAGRTFSRRPPHTSHAAHTHGTKLSGHAPTQAPTGTKLSPHSKKTPISALLTRAGRKLSRSRPGRDANNRCRENFLPQWCQCLLSTLSVGQPRHHRFLAACTHPTDAQWARLPKIACNSISGHNRNRLQTLEYQRSCLKA